jgi:hypothetical protein
MSKISISETQFAFAFFHKYLLLNKDDDVTFCFPSLRQEGDPEFNYAGADLVIDTNLFFQFKMPDFLRNRNTTEIIAGHLDGDFRPYYRFYIKNSDTSNQFNLLKNAARNPLNIVRYISPMFHTDRRQSDDDAFYAYFRMTPENSMNYVCSINFDQFVRPVETNLSTDDSHKICYNTDSVLNNYAYLFSEPKSIKAEKGLLEFSKQKLVFNDNINNFQSIESVIKYVKELFFSEDQIDTKAIINIEQLQTELIVKHDIFWMPVLRSRSKRRTRVIRKILPDNE